MKNKILKWIRKIFKHKKKKQRRPHFAGEIINMVGDGCTGLKREDFDISDDSLDIFEIGGGFYQVIKKP